MTLQAAMESDLGQVEPEAWDRLVPPDEPFLRHAFLQALASSGSVGPRTGWQPCHLLVRDGPDLLAALPLYEKADSYGEFIFDWAWAHAAEQAGLSYYPKLVAGVPFTPASGARLLVAAGQDKAQVVALVAQVLGGLLRAGRYSGVHILFCSPAEQALWRAAGFAARDSFQFHWQRTGAWHSFEDFQASLRHGNRKQVRKERARAQSHGLALALERGESLTQADVAAMYALYRQTVWEKGAQAYLTADFFSKLRTTLAPMTLVTTARDANGICAMALFFRQGKNLYGRYWGARQPLDALHFELCYYLPIEWGLAHGIERFEAGAQGEHKLKRGLLPNLCCSAHLLASPGLHHAVADFCRREAGAVSEQMALYGEHSPFHREATSAPARLPGP